MNTWDDVIFMKPAPPDHTCQKCGSYTLRCEKSWDEEMDRDPDGEVWDYEVYYDAGGWLHEEFLCEQCLMTKLGEWPFDDLPYSLGTA